MCKEINKLIKCSLYLTGPSLGGADPQDSAEGSLCVFNCFPSQLAPFNFETLIFPPFPRPTPTPRQPDQGGGQRGDRERPDGHTSSRLPPGPGRNRKERRGPHDWGGGFSAAGPWRDHRLALCVQNGSTTLSFHMWLADLPARPLLMRGPHGESPWATSLEGQDGRWEPRRAERTDHGPCVRWEETLRGWHQAGLGPPPEQSSSFPETTLASSGPGSHRQPHTHPGHWAHGAEVQVQAAECGLGLFLSHVLEPVTLSSVSCTSPGSSNCRMTASPGGTPPVRGYRGVLGQAPSQSVQYPGTGRAPPLLLTPSSPLCAEFLQAGARSCLQGRGGEGSKALVFSGRQLVTFLIMELSSQ
nr:uncharacterized protein LOC129046282 [Mirounga angustirostris]